MCFVRLMLLVTGGFLGTFVFGSNGCTRPEISCAAFTLGRRKIDGSCNHYENSHNSYGKSDTPYGRFMSAFTPGIGKIPYMSLYGYNLPLPRTLSTVLFPCEDNESQLTHLAANFGLFLMHDMFYTDRNTTGVLCCEGCLGIVVNADSDLFKSCQKSCIKYFEPTLSHNIKCEGLQVEGVNLNTHYIDASQIFGSTEAKYVSLVDNSGKLKTTQGFLDKTGASFMSGDQRINEQPLIMAVYHIFVREYNRLLAKLISMNIPNAKEIAKKILTGMLQHITYNEFLPLLLGAGTRVKSMSSGTLIYDDVHKPEIYHSFSLAYKLAVYSMLRENFTGSSNTIVDMKDQFNNPSLIDTDIELNNIVTGLLNDKSLLINNHISCVFTNVCTNATHEASVDIVARSIQDGRYLSIPPYIVWLALTIPNAMPNSISNIPYHNQQDKTKLDSAFTNLYDVDFISAVLSEQPVTGSMVGPTLKRLFEDQFDILKKGDRFYYENIRVFDENQLEEIRKVTMAHLICRNTDVQTVKTEAFSANSVGLACSEVKDINFCRWKSTVDVKWSEWKITPCFRNLIIRFRNCLTADYAACACSGVPLEIIPCGLPTELQMIDEDFVLRLKRILFSYYMKGAYNGDDSMERAVQLAMTETGL